MTTHTTATDTPSAPLSSADGVRWDLGDLYSAPDDPALARDQAQALADAEAFAREYRGRVGGLGADALHAALERLEGVSALAARPLIYAHLRFAGDTGNPRHGALLQATREHHTRVSEHLLFFDLEWQQVPEARATALLAEPALAHYRHHLENARKLTPYTLAEPEERILAIKANTGAAAFQRLFDETVSALRCTIRAPEREPRTVNLQEALAELYKPDRDARAAAADAVTEALRERERLFTFVFNTLVQDHADNDRLRHRDHPMLARNLANEIGQGEVDALLEACDGGLPTVARYYRLKRRLLGYEALYDYDRYAPVSAGLPGCDYATAREIVLEAYRAFAPEMADVARLFFEHGWIDAELRPGKQGGAFSAGTLPEVHPYILLNYTDNLRDVMTLAHEMGHGIHQYLARPQGLFQMHTPLTTAETASVFGEMLTFRRLMERYSDPRTRLGLLCGKLEDIFATVHRQAVMTRFEQRLHAARRGQGELDAEALGELWMAANRAMFGDALELRGDYRHWWGYISHFVHVPFYCYAYSFGELLVLALYRQYEEEGAPFVRKYVDVLAAGGSAAPAELMARMGMDLHDPGFWHKGLALLEEMVAQAEALADTVNA